MRVRVDRDYDYMYPHRVSIDPSICEGKPTVRGTRMTVEFVLKLLGNGYTADDIVREYPILGIEDVYECVAFGSGTTPTGPA